RVIRVKVTTARVAASQGRGRGQSTEVSAAMATPPGEDAADLAGRHRGGINVIADQTELLGQPVAVVAKRMVGDAQIETLRGLQWTAVGIAQYKYQRCADLGAGLHGEEHACLHNHWSNGGLHDDGVGVDIYRWLDLERGRLVV